MGVNILNLHNTCPTMPSSNHGGLPAQSVHHVLHGQVVEPFAGAERRIPAVGADVVLVGGFSAKQKDFEAVMASAVEARLRPAAGLSAVLTARSAAIRPGGTT